MTIDQITQAIFKQSFSRSEELLQELRKGILESSHLYVVAAPHTTREDWGNKCFATYIDSTKTLPAFLFQEEAVGFAQRNGCTLDSGEPLVMKSAMDVFSKMIAEYIDGSLVEHIKVYARIPAHLTFVPQDFFKSSVKVSGSIMGEVIPKTELAGVELVRAALDTFEPNARRKMDPGGRFENIHTLIESLSQQNSIEPEKLDDDLDLPKGYTRNFFANIKDSNPSWAVVSKYLSFFGLQEYTYIYRMDCREILQHLKAHPAIDKNKLKYPAGLNAEKFKLESIERGKDKDKGAFVYQLTMTSNKGGQVKIVVSNPLSPALIVGREYQLLDSNGNVREKDNAPRKATDTIPMQSEEELQRWAASLEKKDKKPKDSTPRTYEETRKDEIIGYFRKQGQDGRSAEAKFKALEIENDILDAFYKYVRDRKYKSPEIMGYTAQKLIQQLHMSPYEAYLSLVQLRTDPQATKQRLIYRERDPQYQKKPSSKKEE